jgi:hypothetical protein
VAVHHPEHNSGSELPLSERHRRLDHVLQRRYRRRGWRLEFYSETSAVMVRGWPVQHLLNALLTLVTGGIWFIVWLFAIGFGGERRELVFIRPDGSPEINRIQ